MRTRFRRPVAALASAALILSLASPASAFVRDEGDRTNSVPIVFDVLLLRPIGFLAATALFIAGSSVVLGERKFHILIPIAAVTSGPTAPLRYGRSCMFSIASPWKPASR